MLRRILNSAASRFDATVGAAMLARGERDEATSDAAKMPHEARLAVLSEMADLYGNTEWITHPEQFFQAPTLVPMTVHRVRSMAGVEPGSVLDATWTSNFEPWCVDVREEYLSHEQNRIAAARLFLHTKPKPAAILLHGYRCGHFALEERIWPVQWLYDRGMDVALMVLPFHAVRGKRGPQVFPSGDPRITIEGFRQIMLDVRTLAAALRERGCPSVGVMGMSLGGYASGLLATIDDEIAFAAPIIPCASIADVARTMGLLVGTPEQQAQQHDALDAVLRVTSPLARASRVLPERLIVVGASGDRITPMDHAQRLAKHFGAHLETFHGGHVLQFGRADAFRAVGRMLERVGILARR